MKRTRLIGMILTLVGIVLLLVGLIAPVFRMEPAEPSVGIIGGADSPTYLLILQTAAGGLFLWMAIAGAVMTAAAFVVMVVGRNKKN